ncbi:MAG: (R)-hydratase [Rhodocyclales bacterium GWA2_65_20]|nr:MAG: (R)-hydratase [Rhodocyclales bacterium GWA2_65_20]
MNKVQGYDIEDLAPGMTASFSKTVTEADIVMYAGVSCDINAVHLNEEYARTTLFGGRIAHGMLTAGFISAVLANKLPGPGCIYLGQTLKFKAPVRSGDTVTATVTVREVLAAKKRVILDAVCTVGGKVVLEGESTMLCTSSKD